MRVVFDALERRMWPWYLTGSEALAAYGSPRQTMDTDVMVATTPSGLETLAEELSDALLFAEPIHTGGRWMASRSRSRKTSQHWAIQPRWAPPPPTWLQPLPTPRQQHA